MNRVCACAGCRKDLIGTPINNKCAGCQAGKCDSVHPYPPVIKYN